MAKVAVEFKDDGTVDARLHVFDQSLKAQGRPKASVPLFLWGLGFRV